MSSPVRITNIQALTDFRPALIQFSEDTQVALRSPGSDASKVLGWLQRERLPHWKREIRIRSEEVVRANTKLIEQTASANPRPSVDARKAYELAKRRVREAEEKFERTRYWIRVLGREIERYRASVQPMASIARSTMPAAVSRIDSIIRALDAYTSLAAPDQSNPSSALSAEPADESNGDKSDEEDLQ